MILKMKNRSELTVHACGEAHTIYSNEVEADKICVRVEKCQSKCCVFEGDIIEYTVKICNESGIELENTIFCDDIPCGLSYIQQTFTVDGCPERPVREPFGNKISYCIKKIVPDSEVIISFKTRVE